MKIFSAAQIRAWDSYTIQNEPISSVGLMNRAARVFTDWLVQNYPDTTRRIVVLAGTGNNGGDGLAVARMLDQAQYATKVVVCDFNGRHSADFSAQLASIDALSPVHPVVYRSWVDMMSAPTPVLAPNDLVIDALFGSGLNRPLDGDWAQLVGFLNASGHELVSIDVPSGLMCDVPSANYPVIRAAKTFTFETPKMAFFFPENDPFIGKWSYGSIGLHPSYSKETTTPFHFSTALAAAAWRKPRLKFSHKGSFGHALLIAGSWGKLGAAVLAARACLRAGVGLLTVHTPRCGNLVLQSTVPEAMWSPDPSARVWSSVPDTTAYSAIGVGPGIGRSDLTADALKQLLQQAKPPLVLDADALNLLSENPAFLDLLPKDSILTPHPKEFERLFGTTTDGFQRNNLQRAMACKYQVHVILKGAHTAIAHPDGACWFNATGNAGMATGGTGDVLTGILTGLLAQGYDAATASRLGVYLHGLAGDLAAMELSEEALTAGDVTACLGKAWKCIS